MLSYLKTLLRAIFYLMLFPLVGFCQLAPSIPQWVDDIGGSGTSSVSAEKVDAQNNVYITGIFTGTVDFDPSPTGVTPLTSVSNSVDVYIAKYDTNGALIWAVSLGGTGTDQPDGIDLDSNGNVAISGQYNSSTLDADPGPSVSNLTNAGGNDMFLINLDATGAFLWAKSVGGSGIDYGNKIAIDKTGNRILVGQFQSTINIGSPAFTSSGTYNGLIAKYDQSGTLLWAINLGQTGDNGIRGVAADSNGDIVVSGAFNGTVNFNPLGTTQNFTATGNESYVAKYTSGGQLIWMQPVNGAVVNYSINICVDSNNNIYAVGPFSSPLSFSGGNNLNPQGSQDVFLIKYLPDGTFNFAKGIGGTNANITNNGITVSGDNNIYIAGYFKGTVDFDPSSNTSLIKYHQQQDLFLAKYDVNGGYQWAIGAGNSNCANSYGRAVGVDNSNNVLFAGIFCSTANFDVSNCSNYNVAAQGSSDSFVAKYVPGASAITNNIITSPGVSSFCSAADPGNISGGIPAGGAGVFAYQWQSSTDNITFANIPGATAKDYDPPTINATTYYQRIVTSGSCTMPSISNVVTITVQSGTPIAGNIINAPITTTFCTTGDAEIITGSTPTGGTGTYTYQWQSSADNVTFTDIAGATAIDYDPPFASFTTYYRRMAGSGSCSVMIASNVVIINIVALPVANAGASITICAGSSTVLKASGGTTYQWSPATGLSNTNTANPTASPLVTTAYTVTVSNGSCSNTSSVTVTVIPKPTVDAGTDSQILSGTTVQLQGTITGSNLQYQWSPATYLDDPNSLNPIAKPIKDITYTLTATTSNGCFIVSDDVFIKVNHNITIPNTFTPNADGVNDTWNIGALSSSPNCLVNVYNRYGSLIFKSIGYSKPWDGKHNGNAVPAGTYYYTIDLKDGITVLSGWVAIVR